MLTLTDRQLRFLRLSFCLQNLGKLKFLRTLSEKGFALPPDTREFVLDFTNVLQALLNLEENLHEVIEILPAPEGDISDAQLDEVIARLARIIEERGWDNLQSS